MTASSPPNLQIALLLGKPLVRESVLVEVVERLHRRSPTLVLHHAAKSGPIQDLLFRSRLVVQRGLSPDQLDTAANLERVGVRCCNRIAATRASRDRADVLASLSAVGIRVPKTSVVETWAQVVDVSRQGPIVIKETRESVGRGEHVLVALNGVLPEQAPFRGPYLVQDYIPNNGTVHKLYLAGDRVKGLIKSALPPVPGGVDPGIPFEVDAALRKLARRVGSALDLEIVGVDVLQTEGGACVIDANPFPGFRNVPDGAKMIADHLS